MPADEVLATQRYADGSADVARTSAISVAGQQLQSSMNDLNARLTGAIPYDPADAISIVGSQRVYGSAIYQLTAPTPGGLAPLGVGDGSAADQALLVARASGHAAAAHVTGGQGGVVRTVTTAADDPSGTTVGSLRRAIADHITAWTADQSARSWIVFDPTVNSGVYNITLTADLMIHARNLTVDGRGCTVTLNGGGAPGPVPYGTVATSGAPSGGTTITLNTTGLNYGAGALRVGTRIDITDGTRAHVYAANLLVTAFDATAHTITVDPSTPLPAGVPNGATVILAGNSTGQLGHTIYFGGKVFNDVFGPGKVNIPAGNIIWHNIALISYWGGDVLDVGDAQDFCIRWWTDTVWIDHCSFSNPDPFHDSMFNIGYGSWGITLSWNKFFDHYKAVQFTTGTDGSGGTNPDGTFQAKHSFPPKPDGTMYTTTDPGPYRWAQPPGPEHGNSQGLPITIQTVTVHHCLLDRLGQRAPKGEEYGEFHLYNNKVTRWGVLGDPISGDTIVFPTPGENPTGGSATQIVAYGRAVIENSIYEPYPAASGGALLAIKRTPGGKAPTGYTRTSGNVFRGGATHDPDYDPNNVVPNFSTRYAYTLDTIDSLLESRLAAGAGAGAQGSLWAYVRSVTSSGGTSITDNSDGTATGPATLLTALPTATTVTTSGALVAGKHTPADATSGVLAMTLPTPTRGGERLRVEKVDASAHTVTVTGTIRGVTSTTLTLLGQYDQLEFVAESTASWRIGAQHRPKLVNDALYAAKVHTHAAADVTSGTVAAARLGSGTADNTTILYGDNVWRTAPGGSVVAGQELAQASYWPSGAQTAATTTSSSSVDIAAAAVTAAWSGFTASSLDCTFTVPASRIIDYEISMFTKASTTNGTVRTAVGDTTGTQLAGPQTSAVVLTGSTEQRITIRRRLDLSTITGGGPAAGASFTIRPQWSVGGGSTGTIDVGGVNGPIAMRVFAAL